MFTNTLPDITSNTNAEISAPLQWVGMEGVAVPILLNWQTETPQTISADTNIYVNIKKPSAKGIHMSRLYSIINTLAKLEFKKSTIDTLLNDMIQSQSGISNAAKIEFTFDIILKKLALISGESGYQSYPFTIRAQKSEKQIHYEFDLTIAYSSTCPCSASLARQLHSNAINKTFTSAKIDKATLLNWIQSDAGSIATPHSQRSYAYIKLVMNDSDWPDFSKLIFQLESAIGTPVQAAVKRRDEQEFARLNANNLMFCEDAARRIKYSLEKINAINAYYLKIEHQESLHAHNATVIDQQTFYR